MRWDRVCALGLAAMVIAVALLGSVGVLPTETASASSRTPGGHVAPSVSPGAPASPLDTVSLSQQVVPAQKPRKAPVAPLPSASGTGTRVVFSTSEQRVWLVDRLAGRDVVRRTYAVSGSLTDNLRPGAYTVYSTSRHALGIDDSGTMEYFVRFAHGPHAAIGFHTIPVKDGRAVQSTDQLGRPSSHGCIRQARADAKAMWAFAHVGTTVVVTA